MTSNNGPYMTLQNSLIEVFSSSRLNYNCCLLTAGINAVAVFKHSEQSFKIFDSHACKGFLWHATFVWEMYFAQH